jgi:hypothetical protein
MIQDDPLEELYVDQADINKERLTNALSDTIGIDRESGGAVILPEYSDLSQSQKVFAYLLYRRVAQELGHLEENEYGINGPDLSDASGVPQGTLKRVASDSPIIENDSSKGGCVISEFAIPEAINELGHE